MERRKLIKFGSSSYVLSLPISWLKKNNLRKGDVIHVNETDQGELILSGIPINPDAKKIIVDVDGKSFSRLRKELFSVYTNNYSLITIRGKEIDNVREKIRKILHGFVALEIVQDDAEKIMAQDFLNLSDVSIYENIRRMDIIIRGMMQSLILLSQKKDIETYKNIYRRDHDVNKFYHLLIKVLTGASKDPQVLRLLKISNGDVLPLWLLSTSLEDVGDEIKRISKFISIGRLKVSEKKNLIGLCEDVERLYLDVMKSYYKNNCELAFDIDIRRGVLVDRCNELLDHDPTLDLGRILERMKKLLFNIGQIARVVYESQF